MRLSNLNEELGASFPGGEGEQHWGGKKKTVKEEKAKLYKVFTEEKAQEYIKKFTSEAPAYKTKVQNYSNKFNGYNIEEILDDIEKARSFVKEGEALEDILGKITDVITKVQDDYGDYLDFEGYERKEMEAKHDEAHDLYYVYDKMQDLVSDLHNAMYSIVNLFEDLKDKLNRK